MSVKIEKKCDYKTYSTAAAAGLAGTLNGGATLGASVVVVVDERLHLGVDIKRCV
jgi:hypothetical protein